jgi:hypothetical protein
VQARDAATWSTTSAAPTSRRRTRCASRAGTCRASTSSCRAGGSARASRARSGNARLRARTPH